MGKTAERRLNVFVATRPLLGPEQQVRLKDGESVKRFVTDFESTELESIIQAYAKSSVVKVILALQRNGVFASEAKAKQVFPDLFRKAERPMQQRAVNASETPGLETQVPNTTPSASLLRAPRESSTARASTGKSARIANSLSSTVYLPYSYQHEILNYTQNLLEECCFEFADTHIPTLLITNQWECPKAIELTSWANVLCSNFSIIPKEATSAESGVKLAQMVKKTVDMRNKAVHREWVTASNIEHMLNAAMELVVALRSTEFVPRVEFLKVHLAKKVGELEMQRKRLKEQRREARSRRWKLEDNELSLMGGIEMHQVNNTQSIDSDSVSSAERTNVTNGTGEEQVCSDDFWIRGYGSII